MLSDLSRHVAVIGIGASHLADAVCRYFADVILLPAFPLLSAPTASHPDMLLARVGRTVILSAQYAAQFPATVEALTALCDLRFGEAVPKAPYPSDVPYNVFCHGGRLYCRTDVLEAMAASAAAEQGIGLCHVRQGYAGCSALSLDDFVLTADPSMIQALRANVAAVTALRPGGIRLPGYDCGFIGGASGFCAGTAVFFGDPETHPEGDLIRRSLWEHGVDCLALSRDVLTDFGGIVCFPKK